MKRGWLLCVGLALATGTPAAAQKVTEAEAREGFVSLFNGRDFSGWQFGGGFGLPNPLPKNWSVADGVIQLSGGGSPHLGTQWDYDDFEVRFEWRALKPKYNSGFYVRSGRKVGANQINLAEKAAGNLMQGAKGGKAVPDLQKPAGEWNEWRLRAVGDRVTFWCNGTQAWEVVGFKPARGHLGLQAEGAAMEFRNLRVQEIGWDPLNDLSRWHQADKGPWKVSEDALAASNSGRLQAAGKVPAEYVLRLEWKASPTGKGSVGWGGGAVLLSGAGGSGAPAGEKATKATDNPAGQWNYLELRVNADRVSVWQNGATIFEGPAAKVGPPALVCETGPMAFRNVRLKPLAK